MHINYTLYISKRKMMKNVCGASDVAYPGTFNVTLFAWTLGSVTFPPCDFVPIHSTAHCDPQGQIHSSLDIFQGDPPDPLSHLPEELLPCCALLRSRWAGTSSSIPPHASQWPTTRHRAPSAMKGSLLRHLRCRVLCGCRRSRRPPYCPHPPAAFAYTTPPTAEPAGPAWKPTNDAKSGD